MTIIKFKTNPIKDDYKIGTKILGVGINGKVVECENIKTGEKLALKILRDVPKAKREAELHFLARDHPNIVKIFEVYENTYNGIACLFLIMECMNGGELFSRIQERAVAAFTEREASNVMFSVCSAVAYLHKLNIAHRDIKPENLLYRSCDIWSIGVITYILLCGYPPFFSTHGFPISPGMKHRIRTGQYNFSGPEWDRVSEADIIRRCLITDPAERATIEQICNHKWIVHYNKNPETALATSKILREEEKNWLEVEEEMECALASMRTNDMGDANNTLLEKRRKNVDDKKHKTNNK